MSKSLTYLILVVLITSCKPKANQLCFDEYLQNSVHCDSLGFPLNVNPFYLPLERYIDSFHLVIQTDSKEVNPYPFSKEEFSKGYNVPIEQLKDSFYTFIDTSGLISWSQYLYKMDEPILYNTYLNKDIYRLTWLRSFHPAVVISLVKESEEIYLITKIASEQLHHYFYYRYNIDIENDSLDIADKFGVFDTTRINIDQYNEFIKLLNRTNINCMSPLGICHPIQDGSTWTFESHLSNGYHYVKRNSDTNERVRIVGDFLINLGPAKTEEKY